MRRNSGVHLGLDDFEDTSSEWSVERTGRGNAHRRRCLRGLVRVQKNHAAVGDIERRTPQTTDAGCGNHDLESVAEIDNLVSRRCLAARLEVHVVAERAAGADVDLEPQCQRRRIEFIGPSPQNDLVCGGCNGQKGVAIGNDVTHARHSTLNGFKLSQGWCTMVIVSKAQPPSLPFDLSGVDTMAVAAGGRYRETTLTRLCSDLARAFGTIGQVIVHGEVANAKSYDGRMAFFTLRDRGFEIPVYVPSNRARFCASKNGERVAIAGKIELQPKKAQLQLVAYEVALVGDGAIAAKVEQTRQLLTAEGLLGRVRRPVPVLPRAIGVVCGNDAAVRKDIESVVAARFPGYPLDFCEVTVQGPGAVESILWALTTLQARAVDVIVLARGGGDASQLLPFSDEEVCRAICRSAVPVVSAIGHDGDRPLSDDVADLRAGTPSIAAAMVVPSRAELLAQLDNGLRESQRLVARHLERGSNRLANIQWTNVLNHRLEREGDRLQRFDARFVFDRHLLRARTELSLISWQRPLEDRLQRARTELASAHQQIEALSPMRVFERGYAVVRRTDGSVVRDVASVTADERLAITVAKGLIDARVVGVAATESLEGEQRV